MTLPEAIDVAPGRRAREGEFVGRGAYDRAVSLVQSEQGIGLAAGEEGVRVQGVAEGGGEGTREFVEGMREVGVNHFGQEKDDDLLLHTSGDQNTRSPQQRNTILTRTIFASCLERRRIQSHKPPSSSS